MLEAGPRANLTAFFQTEPYLLARAEPVLEPLGGTEIEVESLLRVVTGQFERLVIEGKGIPPELLIGVLNMSDASQVADTVIPYLSLRMDQKQALLETLPLRERLEKLIAVLAREQEILEIQKNIRSRVENEMGDNQREFLLREQIKAIQSELGERDEHAEEIDEFREKIEAAGMPETALTKARKELDRYEKTPTMSPEASVLRNYLDWLTEMPWNKLAEERLDMAEAEATFGRRPLRTGKGQGAHPRILSGAKTFRRNHQKPDSLFFGASRRRQDQSGPFGGAGVGPPLRASQSGRDQGRGGDSRASADVCRRITRSHCAGDSPVRFQKPRLSAG